jgi:hypothetical protein
MPIRTKAAGSFAAEPRPLIDRVRERVALAGAKPGRRSTPSRSGAKQLGLRAADTQQEATSLRRVFRDLGETHRAYRRRTGEPGLPALRDAAYAFQRDPNLTSLVTVASFLDELGILGW